MVIVLMFVGATCAAGGVRLWPVHFWPIHFSCCVLWLVSVWVSVLCCWCCVVVVVCGGCVQGPSAGLPSAGPPSAGPPSAQNFALFFSLSRRKIRSFLPSLVSSRGILVVFEALGPSNVPVWALWCVRAPPARSGAAAGVSHDNQRTPTCTFERSGLQKHHQNSTRKTKREGKKNKKLWWEMEKKARNFGPPTLRGSSLRTLRGPTLRGPGGAKHQNTKLAKVGSAKVGQHSIGQSRFGQSQSRSIKPKHALASLTSLHSFGFFLFDQLDGLSLVPAHLAYWCQPFHWVLLCDNAFAGF